MNLMLLVLVLRERHLMLSTPSVLFDANWWLAAIGGPLVSSIRIRQALLLLLFGGEVGSL